MYLLNESLNISAILRSTFQIMISNREYIYILLDVFVCNISLYIFTSSAVFKCQETLKRRQRMNIDEGVYSFIYSMKYA